MGSVTLKKVASRLNPSASPASRKRCGTASNPARQFSVLKAPPQIITASQATVNVSSFKPSSGSAKKMKKIWTRIGVLRISST